MKGVAPKGSMLASNILLMIELPAMEAARPARKPENQQTNSDAEKFQFHGKQKLKLIDLNELELWTVIPEISSAHILEN